jgi:hypothetical protein
MRSLGNRAQELETALTDLGLAGQVRVGARMGGSTRHSSRLAPLPDPLPDGLLHRLWTAGGELIEIGGGLSSGRTTLACRLAAEATGRGGLVGWIDLPEALDPRSLRRAGAELRSLLWARPRGALEALRCAELMLRTGLTLVILDLQGTSPSSLARLATPVWTRLLRAARGARATALVLGPTTSLAGAGASPTLGLWTERRSALFEERLFEGVEARATVVRDRGGPTGAEHSFRALQRPGGPPPGW